MIREFSIKRTVIFFLTDWLGSVAMLYLAGNLRSLISSMPAGLIQFMERRGVLVGGAGGIAQALQGVPWPVFIMVAIIWPVVFSIQSVYDGRRSGSVRAEMINVLKAVAVSAVILAGSLFLTYRETSRLMLLMFIGLDLVLLESSRLVLWLYRRSRNGEHRTDTRAVLVVGAGLTGENVVRQLQHFGWADFNVVGYLDDDPAKQDSLLAGKPVIGTLAQAEQVVRERKVHHAVIALPSYAHDEIVEICLVLQKLGVIVHVVPDLFALSFPNLSLDGFGGIPVMHLGQPRIYGWQRMRKRVFDMVIVAVGLLFIWPLLGLIALLIRIDSKGSVFYRQVRVGENGKLFSMLKFRSMQVNADDSVHQNHVARLIKENLTPEQLNGNKPGSLKLEKDPRVTRIGRVIRKLSLDELPQVFNVLRGEMSLVGPRPPLLYETECYKEWHKHRMDILPGMTGIWQVNGRNQVSFDEMVRMDIEYIQNQSLWLDIKILFQTPWAILRTRGAG
jgi:exopolysaccharide biosynthesis polyprenyl glycosylphosphotransferase